MRDVIRSIIFVDGAENPAVLDENYHFLLSSGVEAGEYAGILSRIHLFYDKLGKLPTKDILQDIITQDGDRETLLYFEALDFNIPVLTQVEFAYNLTQLKTLKQKESLNKIIQNTNIIINSELSVKTGKTKIKLKGVEDAVSYMLSEVASLPSSLDSGKVKEGDIREEVDDLRTEYIDKETNGTAYGILTDFEFLDSLTSGVQYGEVLTVAGFTGHCKTTFCLNAFYNSIFYYGNTGAYFSLEMSRKQVKRILSVIHSGNRKFADIHPPLLYKNVKDGKLTPSERDFYLNTVLPDFKNSSEAGRMLVFQPEEASTVPRIRSKLELHHKKGDIDFVVVDHPGLMVARQRTGSVVEDYSQIMKDLKQLALIFDRGRGLAVWVPYQINRTGWREAIENDGVYKIDCLSSTSESEKSSDIVIALYLDKNLRIANQLLVSVLKGRDTEIPEKPVKIGTDLKSRLVYDLVESEITQEMLMQEILI